MQSIKVTFVKFEIVENETSTLAKFLQVPPVGVRVHAEIKYRLSNRREGN